MLGLVALGWWMTGLSYYDRWTNDALYWHRALGLLPPLLAVAQLARRHRRATLPPLGARWEQRAAAVMHRLLLLMSVVIPLSGYLISTSAGAAIPLPGGLQLPALGALSDGVRDAAVDAHYWLAYILLALAIGHAAAACKHQFIDRDHALRRML